MGDFEAWKSWEGRTVDGRFSLQQWLGGSDHSAVFLTEAPGQSPQRTAIKLIQADETDAAGQLSRLRETIRLSDPHLIRVYEAGRCAMDGAPFLYVLMECADDDLSKILPERALEPGEATDLLPPLLDALTYLHKNGFVHSRIKPSNVLAVGEQLKLSSDQIGKVTDPNGRHRRRDVYDAPETAAGIVSSAGDVWSLGVTLLAAMTQQVEIAEKGSPANRDLPQALSDPFRGIVRECLQLDPNRRCSLKEIQARLQPQARSVPAPPEPPPPAAETNPRRPVMLWAVSIVVVLAVVFGLLWFRSSKSSTPAETKKTEVAAAPATSPSQAPAPAPKTRASAGSVVRQVIPEVPHSALNTITGTVKVVVRVEVDASGKVSSATLKSAGPSHYFAEHALQAAQQWEFSAPEVNGQPAPSVWLLQFRFKQASVQASAQHVKR